SRRRHTRCLSDWSSDVCSSDLTLVHAGDTWPQMRASLAEFVPRVKARVAPDRRFGVSLRLSAAAAAELTARPDERAWLRRFLGEIGRASRRVRGWCGGGLDGML